MEGIKKLNDEETKVVTGGNVDIGETVVPQVVNLDEESAKISLENANLSYEITYIGHDTIPNGCVVKSNPDAGSRVPRNSTVRLFVSKGSGVR